MPCPAPVLRLLCTALLTCCALLAAVPAHAEEVPSQLVAGEFLAEPAAVDVSGADATVVLHASLGASVGDVAAASAVVGEAAPVPLTQDADSTWWFAPVTVPRGTAVGPLPVRLTATAADGSSLTPADVAPIVVDAVPAAPLEVRAAAVDGAPSAITVSWAEPTPNGGTAVTGYSVSVRPVAPSAAAVAAEPAPTALAAAAPHQLTVTGLDPGTAYVAQVTATNEMGSGSGAEARATTVPGAPATVGATAGAASAVVRWSAPASDALDPVTDYEVVASPGGQTARVGGDLRSATITGLANGAASTFTVRAVSAAGSGPSSGRSTPVVPRQPGRLSVLTAPAGAVVYGTRSVLQAALRTPTGQPLAGKPVALMARTSPATTWKQVATGTTGSLGTVSLGATVPANTTFLLRHAADAVSAPDSAGVTVGVRPKLVRGAGATTVVIGSTMVVRGSLAPALPVGSPVQLQRLTSAGWRTVANGTMTTTTGWTVRWKPTGIGRSSLRVLRPADARHLSGTTAGWVGAARAENVADVAKAILADTSITLANVHVGGVIDRGTPRQELADLAAGRRALRSSYGTAPGGSTSVDLRLLKALRRMGRLGSVTVSEIAGGSHTSGSTHYAGRAIDISYVNGRHVGSGSSYSMAVTTCRAFGAVRVFSPSYDPYGGHGNHVHCDW